MTGRNRDDEQSVDPTDDPPVTESADHADSADDDLGANGGASDDVDVDLAALIAERDQYRDLAQRVQADFENFRKRSQTQAAADITRATGRMADALLPVIDAVETAADQHPDEVGPLLSALLTELAKLGLERLEVEGQPFDPETAEAVMHQPGEGGEVVVTEVMRSGYRWKGATLRPAMVRTQD